MSTRVRTRLTQDAVGRHGSDPNPPADVCGARRAPALERLRPSQSSKKKKPPLKRLAATPFAASVCAPCERKSSHNLTLSLFHREKLGKAAYRQPRESVFRPERCYPARRPDNSHLSLHMATAVWPCRTGIPLDIRRKPNAASCCNSIRRRRTRPPARRDLSVSVTFSSPALFQVN